MILRPEQKQDADQVMNQATVFDVMAGPALRRRDTRSRWAANGALVVLSSFILLASSRMSIDLGPVPVTMQSIAVILLALVMGPRRSVAAATLYFVQCWAIPGFSVRPMMLTGGYVLGFVAAAAVAGHFYQLGHGRSWVKALVASTLANLSIFAIGLPWLALSVGVSRAWEFGGRPFILVEVMKIICGVALLRVTTSISDHLQKA